MQDSLLLNGKNGLVFQELLGALDLLAAYDFYFVIFVIREDDAFEMAMNLSIPQPPIFQFGHLKIILGDTDSFLLLIQTIMQVIQLFLRYSLQNFTLLHGYIFFVSWLPSD